MCKCKSFGRFRGYSVLPVLVHVNGVSKSLLEANYFSYVIHFSELLDPSLGSTLDLTFDLTLDLTLESPI